MDPFEFEFETTEAGDIGAGEAGAAPSPEPAGEGEAGASSAATEPAPAWAPEFDDRVAELLAAQLEPLVPFLQQQQFQQPQPQAGQEQFQLPDLSDPLSEDFGQNLMQALVAVNQFGQQQTLQAVQEMIQPLTANIASTQEAETVAEGERRLGDILADEISRNGDFPRAPGQTESQAEKLVRPLSEAIFPQVVQRYGNNARAAEVAVNRAAEMVRAIVAEAGTAAVAQKQNFLGGLAGQRGEPGVGAGGGVATGTAAAGKIGQTFAEAYANRANHLQAAS